MRLQSLKLRHFRNLEAQTVHPGRRFNVFAGDNGQGKTNLLEAIYAVCTVRSFRAQRLAEVIAHDQEGAFVSAEVEREELSRQYEITIKPTGRQVRLDGKSVRPLVRYFGEFNVVLFAPEDLSVPRGSPGQRRRFLDRALFGCRPRFLSEVQDYEKALKSRNALLKELSRGGGAAGPLLETYTRQVAGHGARVIHSRRAYVADIAPRVAAAFGRIMRIEDAANVSYLADWAGTSEAELADELESALSAVLAQDRARGFTTVGPHRDDLLFTLGGHSASRTASQGQLRALVLAWKTAELDLLEESLGVPPILLLDDVSSELDPARNQYLFEFLRQQPNQCFITTTHPRHVLLETDRSDYHVVNGAVNPA